MTFLTRRIAAIAAFLFTLGACSDSDDGPRWEQNIFPGASSFAGQCSSLYQKFYLRSIFHTYYYWTEDIVDADPASFASLSGHFDYLVSDDITLSGKDKDAYSTFITNQQYNSLVSGDSERGYGMRVTSSELGFTGTISIAYVVPGSPAALEGLSRGDVILSIDGYDFNDPGRENSLPALFPSELGEQHIFNIAGKGAVTLTSDDIDFEPVQYAQVFTGTDIGYVFFDDHARDAEDDLYTAMQMFQSHNGGAGISDLILDLRYNSGGLLYIANQLSYMIAGNTRTQGKLFERLKYNSNFFDETIAFDSVGKDPTTGINSALPTVSLPRLAVITDHATCSASESIINALTGIGVEVILIGEQTCGKPYGFIGFSNCGFTWLPVEFQSFNEMGDSEYQDGFSAATSGFSAKLPGCVVADDFSEDLGDPQEARIAAALQYLADGSCPTTAALGSFSAASNTAASQAPYRNRHSIRSANSSGSMLKALQGWSILSEREVADEAQPETGLKKGK